MQRYKGGGCECVEPPGSRVSKLFMSAGGRHSGHALCCARAACSSRVRGGKETSACACRKLARLRYERMSAAPNPCGRSLSTWCCECVREHVLVCVACFGVCVARRGCTARALLLEHYSQPAMTRAIGGLSPLRSAAAATGGGGAAARRRLDTGLKHGGEYVKQKKTSLTSRKGGACAAAGWRGAQRAPTHAHAAARAHQRPL